MRRVTGMVVVLGLLLLLLLPLSFAGTAMGASAVFSPGSVSAPREPGSTAVFDIGIECGLPGGFNLADVVIGSDDLPADRGRLHFSYSDAWRLKFANVSPSRTAVGVYAQDIYVGGNNPTSVGGSCSLGTLTVDTGGLKDGDYRIRIDGSFDGISGVGFNDTVEPLVGVATIHIPEPASLLILVLGGWVCRRSGW